MADLGPWAVVFSTVLPRRYSPLRRAAAARLEHVQRRLRSADSARRDVEDFAEKYIGNEREGNPALVPVAEARRDEALSMVDNALDRFVPTLEESERKLTNLLDPASKATPSAFRSAIRLEDHFVGHAVREFSDKTDRARRYVHPDPRSRTEGPLAGADAGVPGARTESNGDMLALPSGGREAAVADPGPIERARDAVRRERPAVHKRAVVVLTKLTEEWDKARERYDGITDAAADLARAVDVTKPERMAAADQYETDVLERARPAFDDFAVTLTRQTERLRDIRERGTSRDLEQALDSVNGVMNPVRENLEQGLKSAEALLRTAQKSLKEPAAPAAPEKTRTDLHGPRRPTPGERAKQRGRAKDTLRAGRAAQQRRKAAPEPRGRGRS